MLHNLHRRFYVQLIVFYKPAIEKINYLLMKNESKVKSTSYGARTSAHFSLQLAVKGLYGQTGSSCKEEKRLMLDTISRFRKAI